MNAVLGMADLLIETKLTGEQRRYLDVMVEYAKASPDDTLIRITLANRGQETVTSHLLPTLWFRNSWAWGRQGEKYWPKPSLRLGAGAGGPELIADHATSSSGGRGVRLKRPPP